MKDKKKIDKRMFKKEGEELQQYLHFKKRHGVRENKKGKGSYKRNKRIEVEKMEIIKKEIIKKVELYVAFDGREFEDEDECADYECELLSRELCKYGYADDWGEITNISYATILVIPTKEILDKIIKCFIQYGYDYDGLEIGLNFLGLNGSFGWRNCKIPSNVLPYVVIEAV